MHNLRLTSHGRLQVSHLCLRDHDGTIMADRSELITIELHDTSHTFVWSKHSSRSMLLNPYYRCYLSPAGHATIRNYLKNEFRSHFLVYMTARFADDTDMHKREPVRHAIGSFLEDYSLPVDARTMARLSKDWYRFKKKSKQNYPIPIFF